MEPIEKILDDLIKSHKYLVHRHSNLEKEFMEKKMDDSKRFDCLEKDLDDLKKLHNRLRNEHENLEKDSNGQFTELFKRVDFLEGGVKQLQEVEENEMISENQRLKAKLQHRDRIYKESKKQIDELASTNYLLREKINKINPYGEEQVQNLVDRLNSALSNVEELSKQRDALLDRNRNLVADNQHLASIRPGNKEAEILDLETEVGALKAELSTTKKTLEEADNAIAFYTKRITDLYNSMLQEKSAGIKIVPDFLRGVEQIKEENSSVYVPPNR